MSESIDLYPTIQHDLQFGLKDFLKNIQYNSNVSVLKNVDQYEKLQKIGQGTFGEVFKVRDSETKKYYALKRIKLEHEKEGFPITALREIKILQSLSHPNIVCLKEICYSTPTKEKNFKPEFYLLFDLCDHDLAGLLSDQSIHFSLQQRKSIMKQLFTGIFYLHRNNIIHRDLKAANILIERQGTLKIADFGLARYTIKPYKPDQLPKYTSRVVTMWYRPPEILLNDRHYGKAVDIWGAGCIMAELWTKYPIMQGDNEMHQLRLIINLCGSISEDNWPGVSQLEAFKRLEKTNNKRHVKNQLAKCIDCPSAVDLIDKLLVLDPRKRISANQALCHEFFYEDPMPGGLGDFSNSGSYYELLSNQKRSNQSKQNNYNRDAIKEASGMPDRIY